MKKDINFFLKVFFVPLFVSLGFFQQILFPGNFEIQFVNILNKDNNQLFLNFSESDLNKLTKQKIAFLPSKVFLNILKLPTELGEYDYCISQKSYVINANNDPVEADNKLSISTGGSILNIEQNTQVCSDDFEPNSEIIVTGFSFNDSETIERINLWGLDFQNTKHLYGRYEVSYSVTPKHASLIIIFPIFIFYFCWTTILFYRKVKKEYY